MLKLSHEVLIPRKDVVSAALVLLVLAGRGVGVLDLVLRVLLNEVHDGLRNVRDGDLSISTEICAQRRREKGQQGVKYIHKYTSSILSFH